MTRRLISPPRPATDALIILGQQIREKRVERKLTAKELAERAMVSQRTVSSIERGDPAVSIGNVFAVAYFAGVPLFGADDAIELAALKRIGKDKLALMPTRVFPEKFDD